MLYKALVLFSSCFCQLLSLTSVDQLYGFTTKTIFIGKILLALVNMFMGIHYSLHSDRLIGGCNVGIIDSLGMTVNENAWY